MERTAVLKYPRLLLRPHPRGQIIWRGVGIGVIWGLIHLSGLNVPPLAPSSPFAAEPQSPPKSMEDPRQEGGREFWAAYQDRSQKGEWEKGKAELEKLYQWKLDRGIRNHYGFASALIRESLRADRTGKKEQVPALLQFAQKMSPDFSQVYFAQAAWLWGEKGLSPPDVFQAIRCALWGSWLSLSHPPEGFAMAANLTLWVVISLFLLLAVVSFYILGRYHPHWTHHLQHALPFVRNARIIRLLALLILLGPLFLGLGWIWLFAFWFLLLGVYASAKDRRAFLFIGIISLALPVGLRWYGGCLLSMTRPGFMEIAQANWGVWSPALYERLDELRRKNPSDLHVLQAAGLVAKRMGRYDEAEELFRLWTALDPHSPAAHTSLGNVFFATQRFDAAIAAYRKALDLGTSQAEAHYNLGQVYLQKLQLNEAESHFQEARNLAPALISYYTEISSPKANRMMIDPTLPPLDLWGRIWNAAWNEGGIASILWASLWDGIPLTLAEVAMILLLLTAGWILPNLLGRKLGVRSCETCGQLICPWCRRSMMMGPRCFLCRKVLAEKPSVEPQTIMKKHEEIVRYRNRQKSTPVILSWILPGLGHLYRGHALEGTFWMFLVILWAVKLGLGPGWIPSPMLVHVPFRIPGMLLALGMLILVYSLGQVRMKQLVREGGRI